MTFILIMSSVTMVLAVEAGHRMDRAAVEKWMLCKEVLMNRLNPLDLNKLAQDVSPFLFDPNDLQRIHLFSQFIHQSQF